MRTYTVEYRMHSAAEVESVSFAALNKIEAYDIAVYEIIPDEEGSMPWSAWVSSVQYANGKVKRFNTHEGQPY